MIELLKKLFDALSTIERRIDKLKLQKAGPLAAEGADDYLEKINLEIDLLNAEWRFINGIICENFKIEINND